MLSCINVIANVVEIQNFVGLIEITIVLGPVLGPGGVEVDVLKVVSFVYSYSMAQPGGRDKGLLRTFTILAGGDVGPVGHRNEARPKVLA